MNINNIFKTGLISLTVYSLIHFYPLKAQADIGDPNGPDNQPQAGWTQWQRWDKLTDANIDFGLSNTALGAGLELQNLCFGEVDTPNTDKKKQETYWWRLTSDLNQIGSGQIEYGCWINNQFKGTNIEIAYSIAWGPVPCWRVNPSVKNGLIIRQEPTANSRRLGVVKSGHIAKGDFFPTMVTASDNRNWIPIESPRKGWISTGKVGVNENVSLCKN